MRGQIYSALTAHKRCGQPSARAWVARLPSTRAVERYLYVSTHLVLRAVGPSGREGCREGAGPVLQTDLPVGHTSLREHLPWPMPQARRWDVPRAECSVQSLYRYGLAIGLHTYIYAFAEIRKIHPNICVPLDCLSKATRWEICEMVQKCKI